MSDVRVRLFSADNADDLLAWDNFVQAHDPDLGYANMVWMRIFQQAFGHTPYPLAALRDGKICGILPLTLIQSRLFGKLLVSMPFVNYGGILAKNAEIAHTLAAEAATLRQRLEAKSVELRYTQPSGSGLPAKKAKVSMMLHLPGTPDTLWAGFKDKVRNQVRKARKNGLVCDTGKTGLLDDFYSVFCVNMRDLGTPVYAKSFFATVLDALPDSTRVVRVRLNGKCIAAGIIYTYGTTMQMPWASSLLAHRDLCPNHALYWQALETACLEGYTCFDFGRSTPESGPWRFKKQWGTHEVPLHWEYILPQGESMPELNVRNPKYKLAISAWKKLPLPVANTLGPWIARCIP